MSYFIQTRSSFYSFLFTIPLFIIYEIGIIFLSKNDITEVKTDVKHLSHRVSQIETKILGSTMLPDEVYAKNPGKF